MWIICFLPGVITFLAFLGVTLLEECSECFVEELLLALDLLPLLAGVLLAGLLLAGVLLAGLLLAGVLLAGLLLAGLLLAGVLRAGLLLAGVLLAGLLLARVLLAGLLLAGVLRAGLLFAGLRLVGLPLAGVILNELFLDADDVSKSGEASDCNTMTTHIPHACVTVRNKQTLDCTFSFINHKPDYVIKHV